MDFELPDLPDAKVAQEQSRVQEEKLKETIIERMGYFILKVNNQIKQAIDSGKFCCTFSISGNEIYKILSQGNEAEYIISQQIVMYEEENSKIEAAVLQYEDYEKDTYTNITNKSEDVELLVQFYPQLKSNSLVKEQIKTYRDNTNQIKKLKSKQIELQKYKWWLTCKTS